MCAGFFEAVAFKPKMDIYFLGFGVMNQYDRKDFTIKYKYNLDGLHSEER